MRFLRDRLHRGARRHETDRADVYCVEGQDGTRIYIATWEEERPLNIADPLTTKRRTVSKRAATLEEACRLKAEGEAAERKRRRSRPRSAPQRLGERMMAAKWFEYWVRR